MRCEDLKIAVYGAGAMGTVLGALLTKSGLNVTLVTRNEAHVSGLNAHGAQISLTDGTVWNIPVKACTPENMQNGYDVVFLMTKQRQNADIATFLKDKLTASGVVCTTQNGLPEEGIAAVLGKEKTLGCVTSFGANFVGEGKVELTSKIEGMSVQVGAYENGEGVERVYQLLCYAQRALGVENFAKRTENLIGARWSKLCINAAFSGLSVITGQTFGELASKPKSRKLALGVLREGMSVANALGVTLEKMQGHDMQKMLGGGNLVKRLVAYVVLPFAMKKHKKLTSGMLRDVQAGKKCEIDFINGAIVRKGEEAGVETPLCAQIVEMVHGIENGLYEITPKNLDFFE